MACKAVRSKSSECPSLAQRIEYPTEVQTNHRRCIRSAAGDDLVSWVWYTGKDYEPNNYAHAENVRFCEKCSRVWENYRHFCRARGSVINTNYYEDFPTIGIIRESCPQCTRPNSLSEPSGRVTIRKKACQ